MSTANTRKKQNTEATKTQIKTQCKILQYFLQYKYNHVQNKLATFPANIAIYFTIKIYYAIIAWNPG